MRLSLVMPYYMNPRMLAWHLRTWRYEWSAYLKDNVEVVIVDDGSPEETAEEVLKSRSSVFAGSAEQPFNAGNAAVVPTRKDGRAEERDLVRLYRVLEDRLWHQHGARNLGAHVAQGDWLLMTDMDHVVPASTMSECLRIIPTLSKNEVLTFGRVDAPPTLTWKADHWAEFDRTRREDGSLKPHVNSFVVSRERYWKVGGYDEDLCGIYGTDSHFRGRLFGSHTVERHLDYAPLIRVDRSVIDDASTRGIERKTPGRNKLKQQVYLEKALCGRAGKITALNFPWERVEL